MAKAKSLGENAVLNIIKQCCNILFPLVTYPYIVRVLGDANIGRYSFADSIVQYFIIAATLGAPGYAIREGARIRDDKERIVRFTAEIFTINTLTLVVSYVLLVICVFFVDRIRQDAVLVMILSINIVTSVVGRDWINTIYEDFAFITIRYIVCQLLSLILMFVFVKDVGDTLVYTSISLVATSGAQLINIFYTWKKIPFRLVISKHIFKHLKPIGYMCAISVASIIYINSDVTILGFFRTDEEVGTYYIVSKIYTILKALINAIIMVIIPRMSFCLGKADYEGYNRILSNTRSILLTLVVPCATGIVALSENVIQLINPQSAFAGVTTLRILSFTVVVAAFAYFYSSCVLIPNKKENLFLIATSAAAVLNACLNFIMVPLLGINGAAITTLIAEILVMGMCKRYSAGFHGKFQKENMVPIIVGSVAILVVCNTIMLFQLNVILETVIAIALSVIVYPLILLIYRNPFALSALRIISRKAG